MIGLNLPQNDALRGLVRKIRDMAVRYRKWAGEASGSAAEEFDQLADSSEHSANELEALLRREEQPPPKAPE
jgi:hypothetical protein